MNDNLLAGINGEQLHYRDKGDKEEYNNLKRTNFYRSL